MPLRRPDEPQPVDVADLLHGVQAPCVLVGGYGGHPRLAVVGEARQVVARGGEANGARGVGSPRFETRDAVEVDWG